MQTKMDKLVWAKYSFAGDELVEEATEVSLIALILKKR